jgi:hypothetical protein
MTVTVLTLMFAAAVLGGVDQVGIRSAQPKITFVDAAPPPATLRAMVNAVACVVHARVEKVGLPAANPATGATVSRRIDMRVLQALRGCPILQSPISVVHIGGSVDVSGTTVQTYGPIQRQFQVGNEAVLFLMPAKQKDAFNVIFGEAGVFWAADDGASFSLPYAIRKYDEFGGRSTIPRAELWDILAKLGG